MTTVAKILIAIVFVVSNVFLGFTLAAVGDRDDNPKYRYMREKVMRDVVKFDIARLKNEIEAHGGVGGERPIQIAIDQLDTHTERQRTVVRQAGERRMEHLQEIRDLLQSLNNRKVEITNFAAVMISFREAIESVSRQYMSMQDVYQDLIRQYESLAVQRQETLVERGRLLEDRRAIEHQMQIARDEHGRLSDRIEAMVRHNPALPDIVRTNGRMVRGRVAAASEPPGEVVILDVGSQAGVARGQRFSIYGQDGEFKAYVVVRTVEPTRSRAIVEPAFRDVRINVNDDARRSSIAMRSAAARARTR